MAGAGLGGKGANTLPLEGGEVAAARTVGASRGWRPRAHTSQAYPILRKTILSRPIIFAALGPRWVSK
jgi:hypothetical protein